MIKAMGTQKNRTREVLLNEAKKLSVGDLEAAAKAFLELTIEFPGYMEAKLGYAAALYRLKRYADAAPQFESLVHDQPTNEWASLGLFHSLWKIDRWPEAVEEIRRFRDAGGDSMEYRRLFKDLEKEFPSLGLPEP
jgi:predicted Zn-dependent protease